MHFANGTENDSDFPSSEPFSQVLSQVGDVILAILEDKDFIGGVELFEFIINPFSYDQSVENLVALSELAHQRKVYIEDIFGGLYVRALRDGERPMLPQMQIYFCRDDWKKRIEISRIINSNIPNRES